MIPIPQNLGFVREGINKPPAEPRPHSTSRRRGKRTSIHSFNFNIGNVYKKSNPGLTYVNVDCAQRRPDLIVLSFGIGYVDDHFPSVTQASKASTATRNESDLSKLFPAAPVLDSGPDQATKIRYANYRFHAELQITNSNCTGCVSRSYTKLCRVENTNQCML